MLETEANLMLCCISSFFLHFFVTPIGLVKVNFLPILARLLITEHCFNEIRKENKCQDSCISWFNPGYSLHNMCIPVYASKC